MKFNIQVRLYNEKVEDEDTTELVTRYQNVIIETNRYKSNVLEAKNSRGKIIDTIRYDECPKFTEKIIIVTGTLHNKHKETGHSLGNYYLLGEWLLRRNR